MQPVLINCEDRRPNDCTECICK